MTASSYVLARHDDGSVASFSLGFSRMDSFGSNRLELQNQQEKVLTMTRSVNRQLSEQKHMLDFFLKSYDSAYYVDLIEESMQVLHMDHIFSEFMNLSGRISDMADFIEKHVHPDDRELIRRFYDKDYVASRIRKEGHFTFQLREIHGGMKRTFRGHVIKGADEYHVLLAFMDISEELRREKQQQEQLQQALSMAQSANRAKTTFLNNMSHDIRTPMNAIVGMTTLALANLENRDKIEDYLHKISVSSQHLLSLINDILDMSQIEQSKIHLNYQMIRIEELVDHISSIMTSPADNAGLHFQIETDDFEHERFYGDALRIKQILINLLSNALKYGGDTVTVSLVKKEDMAVVRVDSNGDRIPPSLNEKIFEKFFHGGKGTGLGLPLARTLAELHGGRLYLDVSRQDANSFVLELPLEHPESISLDKPDSGKESAVEMEYDDSKRSVLIVEDNMGFRLYLAEALSEEYNVHTAANGRAAIEILDADKVDLIVSDIMMPFMDGCELCNTVKSTMEYCHIPVILLTAAVGMDTRIETLHVGADGYIEKPFPIELLMANIANLFKNREIAYHQFSNSPLSQFSEIPINKIDEALMTKLNDVMIEKMSESSLCVDDLSSALNISNSTLYRKVKANTGMNVSEYIRVFRLKRAAELLASGQYRINEVADMVGFSSSTYFSTNFQKQFNTSPSAFVKSLGQKTKD